MLDGLLLGDFSMEKNIKIFRIAFFVLLAALVFGAAYFYVFRNNSGKDSVALEDGEQQTAMEIHSDEVKTAEAQKIDNQEIEKKEESKVDPNKKIILDVPFVSQAPTGNWNDDIFQNGCEETAAMMAMAWAKGEDIISSADAAKEIEKISKLEKNIFGHSVDTSVDDVVRFVKKYYAYDNVQVQYDFGAQDIIDQLRAGKLVLVPTYGRALGNPNYTSPGPITHMLVIIGYNPVQNEFITNDPGTRKGKEYRYKQDVLMGAVWNYPTGEKHPDPPKNTGGPAKVIVVGK